MSTAEIITTIERAGPAWTPTVSVCIPLYNKERFIGETIASVLAQTYRDFELVVLDNASVDRSVEVVRSFDDPRIRLVHNSATVTMTENYNRVVAASRSPIVKVINADDQITPTALERQVAILDEDPGVCLVSCRQSIVNEDSEVFARNHCLRTPDLIGRQDRETVVRRVVRHGFNPIGNPGNLLFRRDAFDACGGWDSDGIVLDVDLAVRLLRHGAFYGIPEDLAIFRLAPMSHSTSARLQNMIDTRRWLRGVSRGNRDVVRPRDRVLSAMRVPVSVAGMLTFFAVSSPADSRIHRVTAKIMSAYQPRQERQVDVAAAA